MVLVYSQKYSPWFFHSSFNRIFSCIIISLFFSFSSKHKPPSNKKSQYISLLHVLWCHYFQIFYLISVLKIMVSLPNFSLFMFIFILILTPYIFLLKVIYWSKEFCQGFIFFICLGYAQKGYSFWAPLLANCGIWVSFFNYF